MTKEIIFAILVTLIVTVVLLVVRKILSKKKTNSHSSAGKSNEKRGVENPKYNVSIENETNGVFVKEEVKIQKADLENYLSELGAEYLIQYDSNSGTLLVTIYNNVDINTQYEKVTLGNRKIIITLTPHYAQKGEVITDFFDI